MSFLHNQSTESVTSCLDLWAVPPSQAAVQEGNYIQYQPISSLDDATCVEFSVSSSANEYIDLPHCLLYVKCKIVGPQGAASVAAHEVAPVNNFLHSLWSQLDVSLNSKLVSQSSQTYAYRSYLSNVLSYDSGAKSSHLTAGLFYADTAGKMETTGADNTGYTKRKSLTKESKAFELIGPIHADIFSQDKFLLNNVQMNLKFTKNKDSFMLMSAQKNEHVKLLDVRLIVRKVKLLPDVLLAHTKALEISPCKYPIVRTELKSFSIAAGLQSKTIDYLHSGTTPRRIIIGFVSNKALNGDYELNPFNFQHFNLNYLTLHVDSQQVPSRPLTPDFASGEYIEAYYSLFNGSGIHFGNQGNCISREAYGAGYTLFALDLTPCLTAGQDYWNLQKQANMRLELRWSAPLAEGINCVCLSEFDNLIQIDKQRSVIVDYST